MKRIALATLLSGFALCGTAVAAETKLTWHGHATFEVVTPKGTVLFIDPWLKSPKNPRAANNADPLAAVTKADFVLVTHAHNDHMADATAIAKKTGAKVVTNADLGRQMMKLQGLPREQAGVDTLMNIGGEITIAGGEIRIAMVNAVHSSGMGNPYTGETDPAVLYGGNPAGFIIQIKDGPTIYHSGDTAYFGDMKVIGEQYPIDVALLAIGGHFTMEPDMAARAARDLKPRLTIPQHFGTFPILTADAKGFTAMLDKAGLKHRVMEPGETVTFSGRDPKR